MKLIISIGILLSFLVAGCGQRGAIDQLSVAGSVTGSVTSGKMYRNVTYTSGSYSVTLTAPLNGSTVPPTLRVMAQCNSADPVDVIQIYVDGNMDYEASGGVLSNEGPSKTYSAGSHSFEVKCWNVANVPAYGTGVLTIKVSTTSTATPAPTPAPTATPVATPTSGTSASGSAIPPLSSITDSAGAKWTVSGGVIYRNGSLAGYSMGVVLLLYYNGAIYQENNQGGWWKWNGTGWTAVAGDPRGASGPAPSASPISTSGGKTINNLQTASVSSISKWIADGNCGNDNGCSGTTPNYGINYGVTSPSTDGNASEFYIGGNAPWTGGYLYRVWSGSAAPTGRVTQLLYQFDLYVPSSAAGAYQAIEWECQQSKNGLTYNFAWQLDSPSGHIRIFDFTNKNWVDTNIGYKSLLTTGKWHHIAVQHHTTSGVTYHDWIKIDGTTLNVNRSYNAKDTGYGDQFTNAFQLDLNGSSSPYSVYVDAMSATIWQ